MTAELPIAKTPPFTDEKQLSHYITECAQSKQKIVLCGGGSKDFYGNPVSGSPLDLSALNGICDYSASELYITARAATPLAEINTLLQQSGQMLPFDPPQFGGGATLGGAVAAGLSGPSKPRYGGVRDAMLGVQIINGRGELLNFGGRVMKNVAGYDVSRLMAGALGTLGVITRATVKVIPAPTEYYTVVQNRAPHSALETIKQYTQQSLPLIASFYENGRLYLRFAGSRIQHLVQALEGERYEDESLWQRLRDHDLPFFRQSKQPLWRISLPPAAQVVDAYRAGIAEDNTVFTWNGAVYWQAGGERTAVQQQAQRLGGYACLFRRADTDAATPFLPAPPPALLKIQARLRQAFDPADILNAGRMYAF